jgi:hypothetical protein|tara:strand:- start:69 stop:248 length:180 start_codon:yes stop_codon:yes gene_type:complete
MFDHMFDSKEIAKKEFERNMRELSKLTRQLKTIDLKIYNELWNIKEELSRVYFTLFKNK